MTKRMVVTEEIATEIINIDAFIKDIKDEKISFDDMVSKVPNSKEAALLCIHFIAASQVKEAICDHHSPDPDWVRILAIMWKHFPEFSTNIEGKRFL